jgi:hypothetical protein
VVGTRAMQVYTSAQFARARVRPPPFPSMSNAAA